MRRYLLAFCVLIVVNGVFAGSAVIEKIRFVGNRDFSSPELLAYCGLKRGQSVELDALDRVRSQIVDSLIARDYLLAAVDSVTIRQFRHGVSLSIFVQEGRMCTVRSLRWAGDSLRAEIAPSELLIRPGAVFQWSRLRRDLELILDRFNATGYPYARVELERVDTDEPTNGVDVFVKLSSGPYTTVEFVEFRGLHGTSENFLRRYVHYRVPAAYSDAVALRAQRRLGGLEFLRHVMPAQIVVQPDGTSGVLFDVQEQHATRVDAVAGFVPGTKGRSGTVSGLVNLDFVNLLGSGRKGKVHWERPDSKVQSVEVGYREPWIFNQPLSLSGDFAQRVDDTLYVTRNLGAGADLDLGGNVTATGAVRFNSVLADSAAAALLGFPNSNTVIFESGLLLDTRDFPPNPRHGVLFNTTVGTGTKRRQRLNDSTAAKTFTVHRVGVDVEAADEVVPFWVASLALHARGTESEEPEIPVSDLYRLGGARTLRGYREEQFRGSRVGWGSVEIRYLLGESSRVYLFTDAAGIYRKIRTATGFESATLFRPSVGIGLRLESTLGIWGFDYAVGQDDRALNGKVHFSLYSSF